MMDNEHRYKQGYKSIRTSIYYNDMRYLVESHHRYGEIARFFSINRSLRCSLYVSENLKSDDHFRLWSTGDDLNIEYHHISHKLGASVESTICQLIDDNKKYNEIKRFKVGEEL